MPVFPMCTRKCIQVVGETSSIYSRHILYVLCLQVYSTSNVSSKLTHYTCLPVCGTDRTFYLGVQNDGDLHTPMGGHLLLHKFSSNWTECSFEIFVLYYFVFIADVNPLISHFLDETAGVHSYEE